MTTTTGQDERAEALAERLMGQTVGILEGAAVWLGTELGFYAALRDGGPATPDELAERAGTQPRYTREWLEQQAVAGILEIDGTRYALPAGHATALLDRDSLLWTEPMVRAMLVAVRQLPEIARIAREGGGVSWETYGPEMTRAQGDGNAPALRHALPTSWVPQVPELHGRLTGGARVLEVGCGEGWAAVGLAETYPGITVHGVDVDERAIAAAARHAEQAGVADRVRFSLADAGGGIGGGPYDVALAIECVHDMPYPVEVLAAVRAAIAPDALVYVVDEAVDPVLTAPGEQRQRLFYGFSLLVCLPDSLYHPHSVGTGTVMRPATLDGYARDAGFAGAHPLDVEAGLWRFYRLAPHPLRRS
jgi:SAM-dependent methyltransferase